MNLSISNIAWSLGNDSSVASLMQKYGIGSLDVAPSKYFNVEDYTSSQVIDVRKVWEDRGINIVGMQSLLFNSPQFNVFNRSTHAKMLDRLNSVCEIGSLLGATKLTFGSPSNRDRTWITDDEVTELSTEFFQMLGNIAGSLGVTICLEPNPVCYGANFMTTTHEAAQVVYMVDHPNIKLQLDLGACDINGENVVDIINVYEKIIEHVHISTPGLSPEFLDDESHITRAIALKKFDFVTIEMLAKDDMLAIELAMQVITKYYK